MWKPGNEKPKCEIFHRDGDGNICLVSKPYVTLNRNGFSSIQRCYDYGDFILWSTDNGSQGVRFFPDWYCELPDDEILA